MKEEIISNSGITRTMADFVVSMKYEQLDKPTIDKIKRILVDCIGCALGSFAIDRSKIAVELIEDFGGKPQATIIGSRKTSCPQAAFVNGEIINALDYEPNGPLCPHTCPYVIPPSLAIGEMLSCSGKDLITALVLSMEIAGRVSSSLSQEKILINEPPFLIEPERGSYSPVIFGAVAGACKLLKLGTVKVANALGLAGASVPIPAIIKGAHTHGSASMNKYSCWSGWVAQLATVSSLAAEKGFTGDTTILDGEFGFWKMFGSPFFNLDNLLGGLGQKWHIEGMSYKAYPCCGLYQAFVDGINQIILSNSIGPETIDSIVIKGDPMLLQPFRAVTEISSFEDTQFSVAYVAAVASFYGRHPSPVWQTGIISEDPQVKNLMKKVKIEVHPEAEAEISESARKGGPAAFLRSAVEIAVKKKKFNVEVRSAKGSENNTMTDKEIEKKFMDNASFSTIKRDKVEKAIQIIYELEKIDDITGLMSLLTIE